MIHSFVSVRTWMDMCHVQVCWTGQLLFWAVFFIFFVFCIFFFFFFEGGGVGTK